MFNLTQTFYIEDWDKTYKHASESIQDLKLHLDSKDKTILGSKKNKKNKEWK